MKAGLVILARPDDTSSSLFVLADFLCDNAGLVPPVRYYYLPKFVKNAECKSDTSTHWIIYDGPHFDLLRQTPGRERKQLPARTREKASGRILQRP